jgi:MtN3 and saliva related transmembrane protein
VRLHLLADRSYQDKMVRFIENHDEPRAAATFSPGKRRAAAVAILTLPGARLLHEGQFEGAKARLPVFLGRRPSEPHDQDLVAFYGAHGRRHHQLCRKAGRDLRHAITKSKAPERRGTARVSKSWFDRLPLGVLLSGVITLQGCRDLVVQDTQSLLVPAFRRSEVVGFIAGFGTTFAALPDLLAMLKRRSSAGMNPRMAAIMCVFQFVWVYYGFLIASRPVILWNMVAIVINALSVSAYLYLVRRERSQTKRP